MKREREEKASIGNNQERKRECAAAANSIKNYPLMIFFANQITRACVRASAGGRAKKAKEPRRCKYNFNNGALPTSQRLN